MAKSIATNSTSACSSMARALGTRKCAGFNLETLMQVSTAFTVLVIDLKLQACCSEGNVSVLVAQALSSCSIWRSVNRYMHHVRSAQSEAAVRRLSWIVTFRLFCAQSTFSPHAHRRRLLELQADCSPPSSAEAQNACSCTSAPLYALYGTTDGAYSSGRGGLVQNSWFTIRRYGFSQEYNMEWLLKGDMVSVRNITWSDCWREIWFQSGI
jgi:hypothetical protein